MMEKGERRAGAAARMPPPAAPNRLKISGPPADNTPRARGSKQGSVLRKWSTFSNAWQAVTRVDSHDPDLQRKGWVLAVVLSVMAGGILLLGAFNTAQGQPEYTIPDVVFLLLVVGLFVINRVGYVAAAGLLTVIVIALSALSLLNEDATLVTTYVVMCIPILIASFLLAPWSGFVIAAPLIAGTAYTGVSPADYPALLALAVVALIAYASSRSLNRAYTQTRHQALHDPLTGLPNRALFLDRLQQSVDGKGREPGLSAVLYTDLDHFKVVNDSLGHECGDRLLVAVAGRLRSCLRAGDTAARLGGDEFTALLEDIEEPGDAVRVAERG